MLCYETILVEWEGMVKQRKLMKQVRKVKRKKENILKDRVEGGKVKK